MGLLETSAERRLVLSGMDDEGHVIQFVLELDGREKSWTLGRKHSAVDLYIPRSDISILHAQIRYQPSRGFEIRASQFFERHKVDNREIGYDYVPLKGARKVTFGECTLNVNPG